MQKLLPWHVKASMGASILAKLPSSKNALLKEVTLELGEGEACESTSSESKRTKLPRLHECGAPDPQTLVGQVDGYLLEPGHQHDDVVPPLPPFRPLSRE